jgi:protein TonB
MISTMKPTILILVLSISIGILAQAQNTSTIPENTAKPAKPKSKIVPPKEIDAPPPKPTFDEGKRPIIITVLIGVDGLVHEPKIIQSSDSERADANALEAVKTWKYKPATQDGVPVPVRINIEIHRAL